jgi:Mg2+/citrate symporter
MAYRKTSRRKFQYSQVVPVWTSTHTDTVTLAFQALMSKLGITDTASYFRQLRIPIAISVVVCAAVGATNYGIKGFVLGGLAGLLAPAAMLWFAVLLVGIAIYLGLFVAAWAAIWVCAKWFLSEFFRF